MVNRFFTPNAQFCDDTGAPYAGGKLYFYLTGSATPANTYSDPDLDISHVNSNPVVLDSAGYSGNIFLAAVAYKVMLTDSNDVPIWTADPVYSSDFSTYAQFQVVSGSPNGQLAGTAGTPGALPGSSVAWDNVNNILYVCTTTGNAATAVWTAINASSAAAVVPAPQGRLTLTSGTPVISGDVTAATAIYYTPYVGTLVPIYNGTSFTPQTFAELTLTLTASQTSNTLFDVFVFNNSGVLTLVAGPAWTTSTPGSGNRGTGAGTTQISNFSGLWVNTVQITGRNGASSYTIPANTATYLGTFYTDGSAGQVSCLRTWGQIRRFNLWNAYCRVPIILMVGDSTASWAYSTNTIRQANGSSGNFGFALCGLAEEEVTISAIQNLTGTNSNGVGGTIGIGINSTTAYTGKQGRYVMGTTGAGLTVDLTATHTLAPFIGINSINLLESGNGVTTNTFNGTNLSMSTTISWRG